MKTDRRTKGSGSLRKRGNIYWARWSANGRTYERSTETSKLGAAERVLRDFVAPFQMSSEARTLEAIAARAEGVKSELRRFEDSRPAMKISAAWPAYLASTKRPDTGKATLRMYECQFGRFVAWMKANRPDVNELRHVDRETAQAFARHLAETLSANSFNKYTTLFRRVWKVLAAEARLTFNPWDKAEIHPRRSAPHSRRELTLEELAAVAGSVEGEMRTLFAVGIYTGLRLGDAVRLDWGSVDLVRGLISLVPSKTAKNGQRVSVPIHHALSSVLACTPPKARRGFVMPGLATRYNASPANFNKAVLGVFHRCGIETSAKDISGRARQAVEVGFHSLRHTFVSLSANAGTPLAVVQAIVGHSNPAMTRHYFHESAEALQSAVAALPDVTAPVVAPTAPDATRAKLAALRAEIRQLPDWARCELLEECREELVAELPHAHAQERG